MGQTSNRDGLGARVTLISDMGAQVAVAKAASGYLGSSDPRVHFGLGSDSQIDRLEILWPSGGRQVLENLDVDEFRRVEEPQ